MNLDAITRRTRRQGRVPRTQRKSIKRFWITGVLAGLMVLLIGCPSPIQPDTGGDDGGGGGGGNVSVTGVSLPESSTTLEKGATYQMEPDVAPSDATDNSVTYQSSDTSVATVTDAGLVTAVGGGTATVTVTTDDGGFDADLAVTVTVAADGVTIGAPQTSIGTGQTLQLSADVSPADATNTTVAWASSDDAVATVDATGLVEGITEGQVTITATTDDGGFTATETIDVVASIAVTGVAIDQASQTIDAGSTLSLSATVSPTDATNKVVEWSSDDETVATVDSDGTVTAVGGGTANVTVTTDDGGLTDTIAITVNVPVTGVSIDQSDSTIAEGDTLSLTASVAPADATNPDVQWSSSDDSIATVDASGVVTAVASGTADITVTTDDGGFTDTITITVNVPVTGVSIDEGDQTVDEGAILELNVTVTPAGASSQDLIWTSSDENVATVSDGLVVASSVGTTDITVATADGSVTDTITITVEAPTGPVITISGATNAPAGRIAVAFDPATDSPVASGLVVAGSPNTYSITVPDTGSDYDVTILFYDPVEDESIFFELAPLVTVTTGSTTLSGVDRFADVEVTNLDPAYAGREADVVVMEQGTLEVVASGFGTVTSSGSLFAPELVGSTTFALWNDGTSGTTYDVYVSIALPDGRTEYAVTGSSGGPLGAITTTASGDPPTFTTIDATGAEYSLLLNVDALNVYETTAGEYDGRDVQLEVYAEGSDPSTSEPEGLAAVQVDSSDAAARFGNFVLFGSSELWQPTDGTTYDLYLRIYSSDDGSFSGTPTLVAGSATLPDPLAQLTWSSTLSMPITIDVNATGTFN